MLACVYNRSTMKTNVILNKPINHIAFIMDGNGRWAKKRGLPRHLGHKEACNRIRAILDVCRAYGIYATSLYAFSTENWKRPQDEIDHLFDYLEVFFKREIDGLINDGIKVIISGDISRLPLRTQNTVRNAMNLTKDNNKNVLNICLNYGSKEELTRATKLIAEEVKEGKLNVEDITEDTIQQHLYTSSIPNVDLMIRTSGEQRLSNYLLWQNAYAEFVFTPVMWPDFDQKALEDCLIEFNNRNRRFGGLDNGKE